MMPNSIKLSRLVSDAETLEAAQSDPGSAAHEPERGRTVTPGNTPTPAEIATLHSTSAGPGESVNHTER